MTVLTDDDTRHQAYLDAIAAHKAAFGSIPDITGGLDSVEYVDRLREGTLPDPATPLSPVPDVPLEDAENSGAGSSPSAVASAEAALILQFTHLQESLPALELWAKESLKRLRDAKAEMADIERLLRAHKRLREPVKRKR